MRNEPPARQGELILYRTADVGVRVEVLYESETLWLDQRRLAELFGVDVRTVSEHLRNVYDSGELSEEATLRKVRTVRTEGSREVSREVGKQLAEAQYEVFRVRQDRAFESDFETEVKRLEAGRGAGRKKDANT